MRITLNRAPMLALFFFTLGMPAFGQNPNLFEAQPAGHAGHDDTPLTADRKAAGERESIF
ncbi:MAG: hypothetical protein ACRD88_14125 [Terriglobia bacterium]